MSRVLYQTPLGPRPSLFPNAPSFPCVQNNWLKITLSQLIWDALKKLSSALCDPKMPSPSHTTRPKEGQDPA